MLKFKNKEGNVVLVEHDDGTIEILNEDLKPKKPEEEPIVKEN